MVNSNEDYYLNKIYNMLKDKAYKIKEDDYRCSIIYDKIKERMLMKLDYFPHRVIQWAIMQVIWVIITKTFTNFTCASIPNRWWKQAIKLMDKYMKDEEWTKYCLKMDIKKFYPSINHKILKQLIRKKISCKDTLDLLDMIIDSHPWHKWLPIGSYLSQYLANYYLTYFDHWLKEELKIKYIVRYMDDIVIFWPSKEYLWKMFGQIKEYLSNNLHLTIKKNYQIFPTAIRWVDFVWYRFFYWYRLYRKRTCKKFKEKMKKIKIKHSEWKFINYREWASINSYVGWLMHCDSYRLYIKYIKPLRKCEFAYYYYVISKKNKKKYKKYKKKFDRKIWRINFK